MKNLLFIFVASVLLYSCTASYSFTGTSVGDAKTLSIQTVTNIAPLTPPSYTQNFTEGLKDNFLRQTNLDLIKRDGDLQLTGMISRYTSGPSAVTGDEGTSQNRLTVSVKMKFVNKLDPSQNFEKVFTRYQDYSASASLTSVQDALLEDITDQLSQDIIQASIGSW